MKAKKPGAIETPHIHAINGTVHFMIHVSIEGVPRQSTISARSWFEARQRAMLCYQKEPNEVHLTLLEKK